MTESTTVKQQQRQQQQHKSRHFVKVSNLPKHITESQIHEQFSSCGLIHRIHMLNNTFDQHQQQHQQQQQDPNAPPHHPTVNPSASCVIEFATQRDAQECFSYYDQISIQEQEKPHGNDDDNDHGDQQQQQSFLLSLPTQLSVQWLTHSQSRVYQQPTGAKRAHIIESVSQPIWRDNNDEDDTDLMKCKFTFPSSSSQSSSSYSYSLPPIDQFCSLSSSIDREQEIEQSSSTSSSSSLLYMNQLREIRDDLNRSKAQFEGMNFESWNRYAFFMNPVGFVPKELKRECNAEMCTRGWTKMFEFMRSNPQIMQLALMVNDGDSDDKSSDDTNKSSSPIQFNTLHLCEAPGGFISALNHYLKTEYHCVEGGKSVTEATTTTATTTETETTTAKTTEKTTETETDAMVDHDHNQDDDRNKSGVDESKGGGDKTASIEWHWFGNSLITSNENSLYDMVLVKETQSHWLNGQDETGDITRTANIEHVWRTIRAQLSSSKSTLSTEDNNNSNNDDNHKNSSNGHHHDHDKQSRPIMLVTADCGVRVSDDPYDQEKILAPFIFAQLTTALGILGHNGSLIIKFLTLLEPISIDIMYLLNCVFTSVNLAKPSSTKSSSSEVYAICTGFKGMDSQYIDKMIQYMNETMDNNNNNKKGTTTAGDSGDSDSSAKPVFLPPFIPLSLIPDSFMDQMVQQAQYFANHQKEHIEQRLALFENLSREEKAIIAQVRDTNTTMFLKKFRVKKLRDEDRLVPKSATTAPSGGGGYHQQQRHSPRGAPSSHSPPHYRSSIPDESSYHSRDPYHGGRPSKRPRREEPYGGGGGGGYGGSYGGYDHYQSAPPPYSQPPRDYRAPYSYGGPPPHSSDHYSSYQEQAPPHRTSDRYDREPQPYYGGPPPSAYGYDRREPPSDYYDRRRSPPPYGGRGGRRYEHHPYSREPR